MKRAIRAIDVLRIADALKVEGNARESLRKLCDGLKTIYDDGGKVSAEDLRKLRRTVRRWIKTTKTVVNVIGEQYPED
jgi:hypothetical protein